MKNEEKKNRNEESKVLIGAATCLLFLPNEIPLSVERTEMSVMRRMRRGGVRAGTNTVL